MYAHSFPDTPHTHACACIPTRMHTYICLHTHTHECMHTNTHAYVQTHSHTQWRVKKKALQLPHPQLYLRTQLAYFWGGLSSSNSTSISGTPKSDIGLYFFTSSAALFEFRMAMTSTYFQIFHGRSAKS